MEKNPFFNRNKIRNPDHFFGRKDELITIFTRLLNLQSSDVYGERKIGKSSLLYYIYSKASDKLGNDYKVGYINLGDAHYYTVNDFLSNSLKELGCKSEVIIPSNDLQINLIAFTESIKELRKEKKAVLLIDDFENLKEKNDFNFNVFKTMRSLGDNGDIAYVTATVPSIKTLCIEGNFISPLYNIFSQVHLMQFTPDETFEFLEAKIGLEEFDERERNFIYQIANNYPLHLQIACYHVFENKRKIWDETKLRNDIQNEIVTYDHQRVSEKRTLIEKNPSVKKENRAPLKIVDHKNKSSQLMKHKIISMSVPATIAGFVGFVVSVWAGLYLSDYKDVITIIITVIVFLLCIKLIWRKKN